MNKDLKVIIVVGNITKEYDMVEMNSFKLSLISPESFAITAIKRIEETIKLEPLQLPATTVKNDITRNAHKKIPHIKSANTDKMTFDDFVRIYTAYLTVRAIRDGTISKHFIAWGKELDINSSTLTVWFSKARRYIDSNDEKARDGLNSWIRKFCDEYTKLCQ